MILPIKFTTIIIRQLHIFIGRHANITMLKSQTGGTNTSPRQLPKTKKSQFSGICRYILIGNCQRISDIVIKDHADRFCKLIDVAVPADRNTSTKVIEKLSKYKDLEIEIARMWGMRTESVPVIVGALLLIREGMDQNLGKILGTSNINELQKIVFLGTAHILRRFLSIK